MKFIINKWPFYVAGSVLAVVTVLLMYLLNDNIGLNDALTVVNAYGKKVVETGAISDTPSIDWQFGLLGGIFVGALITAGVSGVFKFELFSAKTGAFHDSALRTAGGGLLGGFLVMLGVQLSGDTIYGHFASAIQLSGGAWLFLGVTMVTGCLLSVLLDRKSSGGK